MASDERGERARSWAETVRRWTERARRRRDAPVHPLATARGDGGAPLDSVVTLTCVVERTQALVRQLEAELQSERALMAARLERLAAENRLLQERLRQRQGGPGAMGAASASPGAGRVSPFRRGQRGQ